MACDVSAVEKILTWSIGGIGLRVAIAWVKAKLGVKDFLAAVVSFVMCLLAAGIYQTIAHGFHGIVFDCLLQLAFAVFVAGQFFYQATK
jgi:hypothetical protein